MNFESYQLDKTVEEGVWRTLPSGLQVKVASLRSPAYQTVKNRLQRKYAAELNAENQEFVIKITCEALAQVILFDWKGALDLEGNEIPFSREVAEEMLLKYEIFREQVADVAADDGNYKVDIAEK